MQHKIAFPDIYDPRLFEAIKIMLAQKVAQPVLVGNPFEIRDFCMKHRLPLSVLEIIDPRHSPLRFDFIDQLGVKMPKASREECEARILEPLWFAASLLANKQVDFCIAGNLSSTSSVLRAGIRVIGLEAGNKTVSSIMFMLAPNREFKKDQNVLAFSDCGVIPEPTPEQLVDIALQTAKNFESVVGETPRVAMLSFSSHGSAKHPNADKIRLATQMIKEKSPNLLVDGELQFDAAIVPAIAAQKVPDSVIAGDANVFIFPSLEAANIGYKIAQRLGKYTAVGPLIQGLRLPIHDLSRGCTAQEIAQVAQIAIAMAKP